jgi:hypothetical protein
MRIPGAAAKLADHNLAKALQALTQSSHTRSELVEPMTPFVIEVCALIGVAVTVWIVVAFFL